MRLAALSCAVSLSAALGGLLAVVLYRYLRARQHLSSFPGPKPHFLLGNLAMLIGRGGQIMPLFKMHSILHARFGSVARFTMGSTPVLVISGAIFMLCGESIRVLRSQRRRPGGQNVHQCLTWRWNSLHRRTSPPCRPY